MAALTALTHFVTKSIPNLILLMGQNGRRLERVADDNTQSGNEKRRHLVES
jgi:hypothetical protein